MDSAGWSALGAWGNAIWRLGFYTTASLLIAIAVGIPLPPGPVSGGAALLVGSITVGAVLLALDGTGAGRLGFYLAPDAVRESGLGLALGSGVGLSVVVLLALTGGLEWVPTDGGVLSWGGAAMSALLFFTLPAAAEEAFVRGYPLLALRTLGGSGLAVCVTASVFGLLHLGNPGAGALSTTNVVLAGVWLGVIAVRTRSLWWATGAHIGWNWTHGFIADVPVSGLEVVDAPGYDGVATGPTWWGGGGFGPEGSVAATLVLGVAVLVCARASWMKPGPAARARAPEENETKLERAGESQAR